MIPVVGVGAGGHARVVLEILRMVGKVDMVGLLDRDESLWQTEVLGVPVLGGDGLLPDLYARGVRHCFIGLGSSGGMGPRKKLYELVRSYGLDIVAAIHPNAIVSPSAVIKGGVTIMAGAIVNAQVLLGEDVILNTGAIVEHNCRIGDHVHIGTGAKLAGSVQIEDNTHIGIGATFKQCIRIGRNVIVGAGAVVVRDFPDDVVVVGNPARVLRHRGDRDA